MCRGARQPHAWPPATLIRIVQASRPRGLARFADATVSEPPKRLATGDLEPVAKGHGACVRVAQHLRVGVCHRTNRRANRARAPCSRRRGAAGTRPFRIGESSEPCASGRDLGHGASTEWARPRRSLFEASADRGVPRPTGPPPAVPFPRERAARACPKGTRRREGACGNEMRSGSADDVRVLSSRSRRKDGSKKNSKPSHSMP